MLEARAGAQRVRAAAAAAARGEGMASVHQPKLGFLHIPKSGGSSLNESLYAAFGLEPVHVSSLVPRAAARPGRDPNRSIEESTIAFVLARNMPFLAGHLTFTALKGLKREFVFTVLRDPRERLVSLYTYAQSRTRSREVVQRHPALSRFAGEGFLDFMQRQQPSNAMAFYLLGDLKDYARMSDAANSGRPPAGLHAFIDAGLRRLDAVYACSNQQVLDDLHGRGLAPACSEIAKNASKDDIDFGDVGSRESFLKLVDRATWLDRLVYERAAVLFPQTVRKPMASDDAFLARLASRFGVNPGR